MYMRSMRMYMCIYIHIYVYNYIYRLMKKCPLIRHVGCESLNSATHRWLLSSLRRNGVWVYYSCWGEYGH